MCLENWADTSAVSYYGQTWSELCSLRFIDGGHNFVIMGPVGVGEDVPGHCARPRRHASPLQRA